MSETQTPEITTLGYLEPVADEIVADQLEVDGQLPPELSGRYLRNGPNKLPTEPHRHWFMDHGMLHGIRLHNGQAQWYRNRWVRTSLWENAVNQVPLTPTLANNPANTHVIEHGGALLALCEGGLPYRVTEELDTVGPYDFNGQLTTRMTAHPKVDPHTGDLFFYGTAQVEPYLTFHIASSDGELVHSEPIEVPAPTMMHDFAITENYVLWLDLPVVHDAEKRNTMPFSWDDTYGARIGVMSRQGGEVRWFSIDPCYIFHVGNAHEEHGVITLDAVRYSPESFVSVWNRMESSENDASTSQLYRIAIDTVAGGVTETAIDDVSVEFPSICDTKVSVRNRYLYAVNAGKLYKYDYVTNSRTVHDFGPNAQVGEAAFVPAADATSEDDGWLMTIVTPRDGGAATFVVLDASQVESKPVATISLPCRVPAGFHGSWIPDSDDPAL